MSRDLLYFTLALVALYLVIDQFAGKKHLSKLADALWNQSETATKSESEADVKNMLDILATAGNIRY